MGCLIPRGSFFQFSSGCGIIIVIFYDPEKLNFICLLLLSYNSTKSESISFSEHSKSFFVGEMCHFITIKMYAFVVLI